MTQFCHLIYYDIYDKVFWPPFVIGVYVDFEFMTVRSNTVMRGENLYIVIKAVISDKQKFRNDSFRWNRKSKTRIPLLQLKLLDLDIVNFQTN